MQKKMLRRMGYLLDQEGIMNRFLRESEAWQDHLRRTRNFIATSFPDPAIRSVAVLGSGWLLDIPLDQLVERFEHIVLIDIHHPAQVRRKVRDMAKVELFEADLTGGAVEQIYQLSRSGRLPDAREELPSLLSLEAPGECRNADALISANLLNQLDIILCDFLSRQFDYQQGLLLPLRSHLQRFHLDWISEKPGCVISDVREINQAKSGEISRKSLIHTDLLDGFRQEQWIWHFDYSGNYHPGSRTSMEVQAIEWS